MGRALAAIRTRKLDALFPFFGVEARREEVAAHRAAIQARFAAEVQELVRLCPGLPERIRFKLFREALRLAYSSALLRAGGAAAGAGAG